MNEDILKHNNISLLKQHRGAGEYIQLYLGSSNLGINIYVPSNLKEMAKNILKESLNMQQYYEENIDKKSEESLDEVADSYNRKRRNIWILVIALSIPAILALLVILMSIFTIIIN